MPWPLLLAGALMLSYVSVPFLALIGALPRADFSVNVARDTTDALRVSLIAATLATLLDGVLGIPLGLWLATTRSRFRHVVTVAVVLPLSVPPVVGGLELILVLGRASWLGGILEQIGLNPLDTVAGTTLAQMFVAAPFVVISARSAFSAVDPVLTETARSLGCNPTQTFLRVLVPTARLGIAAGLMLGWVRCLGEFGATAVLAYHPYSLPTLTFVDLSGGGIRSAIAPGFLVAVVGATVGTAMLWLESRQRQARLDLAEPDLRARASDLPWVVGPGGPAADIAVDVATRVGSFRLTPQFHSTSGSVGILGPSGSGKSLTMRVLAGLLPAHGKVTLADTLLLDSEHGIDLLPEVRQLGYVAQRDSLFGHLDVEGNVTFGIRHLARAEQQRRIQALLPALGLEPLRHANPSRLSGGERQRVALARALAIGPRALLLDESFSHLDAQVRGQLHELVRRLRERTHIPLVLVTHDREDVLELCDYVVVMQDGMVVQEGPIREVFTRPANRAVARLVGIPNVLRTHSSEVRGQGLVTVATDWGTLTLSADVHSDEWDVLVPTEAIVIGSSGIAARVDATRPSVRGKWARLVPEVGGEALETTLPGAGLEIGALVKVRLDAEQCHLVPATSNRAAPVATSQRRAVAAGQER